MFSPYESFARSSFADIMASQKFSVDYVGKSEGHVATLCQQECDKAHVGLDQARSKYFRHLEAMRDQEGLQLNQRIVNPLRSGLRAESHMDTLMKLSVEGDVQLAMLFWCQYQTFVLTGRPVEGSVFDETSPSFDQRLHHRAFIARARLIRDQHATKASSAA